jgi:hypothetical protein
MQYNGGESMNDRTFILLGMFILSVGAVIDPQVRPNVVVALFIITLSLVIKSNSIKTKAVS